MQINFVTPLLTSLFFGCLSAYFAHRKKQNVYLWFLMGFLLGVFGIITIFFVSQQKKQKKVTAPSQPITYLKGPKDKFWYYLDSAHNRQGPMSFQALNKQWQEGKINKANLVWNEELSDWKPLEQFIVSRRRAS
jgi:hypothetical protein